VPGFEQQVAFVANEQAAFLIAGSPFALQGAAWPVQFGIQELQILHLQRKPLCEFALFDLPNGEYFVSLSMTDH
jgi:hypothetical protein